MQKKEYHLNLAGKEFVVQISPLAEQANGSVIVSLDQTIILATAVMSKDDKDDLDYLPLTVDYEEKYYAAGKIYGSRFIRRESRPSENAILTGRLIDRTIRPRFNQKIRRDIQLVITCLSIDDQNDPDILGILAASLALMISDIPWDGPVAGIRIGWSQAAGFIINPTYQERENLDLDIAVSGTKDKINMLEAIAKEVNEDIIEEALNLAQEKIKELIVFQEEIAQKEGKTKTEIRLAEINLDLANATRSFLKNRLENVIYLSDKKEYESKLFNLKQELKNYLLANNYTERDYFQAELVLSEEIDKLIHENIILKEKRPDARKLNEIRSLDMAIDILPRAHGSALFIRGNTQALSVITLGSPSDVLLIQGMEVTGTKRFMHHYNFPPYCSGEVGRLGSPSRREIGHGALAEKALINMIPGKEIFPYTIRAVTEILSSNGSTSMASVCATSLALMAAGVPIKEAVAGIAMGLIIDYSGRFKILTDIQGPEDHHGDMDLKIAGTKNGITAIQMDVKIEGVTPQILKEVMLQAKAARLYILEKMRAVISQPRENLSPFAPRIYTVQIKPDKIGEVIGPAGKIINQIIAETGVTIDIEDSGLVFITSLDEASAEKAKKMIEEIVHDYQIGDVIEGKVIQIRDFGAILSFGSGREGLLHISELAPYHVNKVEDIVKLGDTIKVKVKKMENGKISLSLKDMQPASPPPSEEQRKKSRFNRRR